MLGWSEVDEKTVEETLTFIEGKEMARDAMNSGDIAAPISSYKSRGSRPPPPNPPPPKSHCGSCNVEMDKFVWNPRTNKMMEPTLCKPCWNKANTKRNKKKTSRDE